MKDTAVPGGAERLVEVWGDTVDERHVKLAVVLGLVLSVPSFLVAAQVFGAWLENQSLARTYAMLVGLFACLLAGGISARLFPPKRIVTERAVDPVDQRAALLELARRPQGIGTVRSLPPAAEAELRSVGLYDVFVDVERELAAEQAGAPDTGEGRHGA
ncbi:MAG: hypothetical protein ACRDQ0_05775 [Pseudonocardia sp.]